MHPVVKCLLTGLLCSGLVGCSSTTAKAALECGLLAGAVTYGVCKGQEDKGEDDDCEEKGAIALALAGSACFAYAYSLDNRRRGLVGKEDDLDAQIVYVRGLNEDTRKLNAELAGSVEQMKVETDRLLELIKSNQISQADLTQERWQRDLAIKGLQQQVSSGQGALQVAKDFRSRLQPPSPDLDAAIAQQERLLADARRQVDLLIEQQARV